MLSRKGDGKLIKRKKRKDIQALRSRTRRKESGLSESPRFLSEIFSEKCLCAPLEKK